MAGTTASAWWAMLPRGVREQVDGHVLRDDPFRAVSVVFEAGRNRGLSLHDAQRVVGERHDHHGDRIARTPDSPLDAESLHARAAGLPGRVVAIEAVWAGDTVHEWFVDPPAITADPAGEHRLVTIHRAAAVRYLGAERDTGRRHPSADVAQRAGRAMASVRRHPSADVAQRAGRAMASVRRHPSADVAQRAGRAMASVRRHPSADVAQRAGRAMASVLSVLFHFASPDIPEDRAPRLGLQEGRSGGAIRHFRNFRVKGAKWGKVVEGGTRLSRASCGRRDDCAIRGDRTNTLHWSWGGRRRPSPPVAALRGLRGRRGFP